MLLKKVHTLVKLAAVIFITALTAACEPVHTGPKQVFILYSIGYNNLAYYLDQDINDITRSYQRIIGNNAVIIFSHKTKKGGDYTTPNPPVIVELTKDWTGKVRRDTLAILEASTVSASGETVREVLSLVSQRHPKAEYSILFSSHGTGWTPADYCNEPSRYDTNIENPDNIIWRRGISHRQPSWGIDPGDGSPVVKSFGVQNITSGTYHEININDLAESFPMKMKNVIFDACFMGGIEVAYAFRNVTQMMIASQTEILADGMDYTTMLSYIFDRSNNQQGFCKNYFKHYNSLSGDYRSATISLIDCSQLEPLAEICRNLFASQREQIAALEGTMEVQRYFRKAYTYNHKWFYDLEDILVKSGISSEQHDSLKTALNRCVIYKAATPQFMNDITISNHSGLSMYLPYADYDYLNGFYKELDWNKATGLVQ